jgi:hypothetical protein
MSRITLSDEAESTVSDGLLPPREKACHRARGRQGQALRVASRSDAWAKCRFPNATSGKYWTQEPQHYGTDLVMHIEALRQAYTSAPPESSEALRWRFASRASPPPLDMICRKSERCSATRLMEPAERTSTIFQPEGDGLIT